ncbi:S8 family peptidase [Lachnospiraceae bacterium 54-53]
MEKILDDEYYDFIISNPMIQEFDTGDNVTALNDRYSLLHVHKDSMDACDLGRHAYDNFPSLFTLTSRVSAEKSGIGNIQRTPDLSLFGLGVIIGIIDTGIDYRHPAFRNHDGSTRILSIWDQTDPSGRAPEGFTFGSEYGMNHINAALKSVDPFTIVPTTDTNGHGTAIASIISGSPNEKQSFTGIVPQTKLAVVKLKEAKQNLKNIFFVPENALCYQESDMILGIRYLLSLSQKLNRPLVLCIALGSSQGGHDGHGAISSYLDSIVNKPRISVSVAAGNEGNNCRHYFHNAAASPYCDEFKLNIGSNDTMFSMEIWPFPPGKIAIELMSPDRETVRSIYYPAPCDCQKSSLNQGRTTIWINNIVLEGHTGDQLILVRFDNPRPGVWFIRVRSIEYESFSFHAWLPSGNLITNETYFYDSTPNTTVTSPGNAKKPLTVTAYNQFNDSILAESGRGYTRSGQVVPDIAAPGYRIPCALPGSLYGSITGTGSAAAHAAGAAAMVMEWGFCKGNHTAVTGNQINRMIIRGAQRNNAYTYPNNIWGYGQIDVYKLFQRISVV